jgi:hypothetical protein
MFGVEGSAIRPNDSTALGTSSGQLASYIPNNRLHGELMREALHDYVPFQNAKRIESWSRRAGRDAIARPKNGELKLPIYAE